MSQKVKSILVGALVVFAIMQLFQIDKTNPPARQDEDFITITKPPQKIEKILRTACYDCHSHETAYPWYTSVAPISWWIRRHIDEGREHLDFSIWGQYDADKKDHKLEEAVEEVKEGRMPLNSYTWIHSKAKLSADQGRELADWFASIR